jgi:hypothetical protein
VTNERKQNKNKQKRRQKKEAKETRVKAKKEKWKGKGERTRRGGRRKDNSNDAPQAGGPAASGRMAIGKGYRKKEREKK